jgi:hypothetical protein
MPGVSVRLLDSGGMRCDWYATPAAENATLHTARARACVCVCV